MAAAICATLSDKTDLTGKINARLSCSRDSQNNATVGNWVVGLVPHITLADTSPKEGLLSVSFNYTVQPEHCNRLHSLHGGCVASIFDLTTTLSLTTVSRPGFWQSLGVSRALSVTYLRPAPKGTELIIECDVVQIGRTLAALKGTMRRKRDGQITATCEHTKVNIDVESKL